MRLLASRPHLWALLVLLLATTWLYAPALDFGFIWDDPLWYGRVIDKSLVELVKPAPDFHFYRPGTMLYNRLFLRSDDTFSSAWMHAAQIGWHLLNVALIYALSRRLGLDPPAAVATAGLVAWHPFSHQAVAWAAPQQPLAAALQNGAWLAYLQACQRWPGRWQAAALSLFFFLLAVSIQENTVATAILPLLLGWAGHPSADRQVNWRLALLYPLIAIGFGLLWLLVPRQPEFTKWAFETRVAAYLLQGFIYPLLGRPAGYASRRAVASPTLLALAGLTLGGLVLAAWRTGRGRPAILGLAWAGLGIVPALVGLRYSYVELSPRLLYYSAPGVALLWAGALLPATRVARPRRHRRRGGWALIGLILLQSALLLVEFQRMYTVGTHHLTEMVQTAQADQARLLYVNFPDRYTPKRPPYPLGYWGVTLAPVAVDLGTFPASLTGHRPYTASRSMPWIDTEAREVGPYQIDLRGVITPASQLYRLAKQMDAVYLSRHFPDGSFALEWAGAVTAPATPSTDPAPACQLATFGETACLEMAQIEREPEQVRLILTWRSLAPAQPHDTIFTHLGLVGVPPIAQADGATWLDMLPLTAWKPGDTIREQRIIPLPQTIPPGEYAIRVGVYNWLTGERLPATTPQDEPLPDNGFTVGHLAFP